MTPGDTYRKEAQRYRAMADKLEELADLMDSSTVSKAPSSDITLLYPERTADLYLRILKESGRPMSVTEIFQKMQEHGSTISKFSLFSYLSRDGKKGILRSPSKGFWTINNQS
ncbi:hypothetical protein BH09VER1_BH09VER1_25950 [soil metagenome]